MDGAKFQNQGLFRLSELANFFTDGRTVVVDQHLKKGKIPCDFPTTGQGIPNFFSTENVLTAAIFYKLAGAGLSHEVSAKIVKRIPAGTWQDVRDGFTNYMVVSITGEGGAIFAFDLEDLPEPNTPVSLVIDLAAIRRQVIQKVNDTFEARTKAAGLD